MSLDQEDLAIVDRIFYKNCDDIAVSISRSFERLEERIDASEARIYSRISDLEDRIEGSRQEVADTVSDIKEEIRDFIRVREMVR